ncbi:QcrA and Rieske domain-containing protein [Nonomuraea muscovyensis]|uniref:Cytochrome bc1 complex Rieske iron-sulfur subunit n=1 Tax=Nonomuraea muscovyensis TaxID=1124761 RepID=A0A7X0C5H1_9ACTN|nr:Rieske (2Fe-2S) protein [Nonomuraea muscovyensis]MBB6348503.1 Rieske Fe-S protein [Nonomuraea muscovyensis]MDF2712825.1 Rieske 2Fe-2S protein [Nonomuraea muscovyensis]
MTETTRRAVVLGAGGAGLAAVLSACASYGDPATQASVAPPAEEPLADEASEAPDGGASPTKKAKAEGKALAETADIPSGGGKVFESQKVVVVQTQSGDFKAFTAVCTHAGCTVASVSNGTINCPCHGSKFKIEDGSVAAGPAEQPLEEKKIKVDGDRIMLL